MKGVSPILSHSTLLVIGIIAMGLIIVSIADFLSDTEETLTTLELNYMANTLKTNLLKIYSVANSSSDSVNGKFQIPVAEKIGSKRIYVEADNNFLKIIANLKNKKIEISRAINIDANVTGKVYLPAFFELEKTGEDVSIRLVE
jgi:hypothetical protein